MSESLYSHQKWMSFEKLISLLRDYYSEKVNRSERFRFWKIIKHHKESIGEYVFRIQAAAQKWYFGDYLENDVNTTFLKYKKITLNDEFINQFVSQTVKQSTKQQLKFI